MEQMCQSGISDHMLGIIKQKIIQLDLKAAKTGGILGKQINHSPMRDFDAMGLEG